MAYFFATAPVALGLYGCEPSLLHAWAIVLDTWLHFYTSQSLWQTYQGASSSSQAALKILGPLLHKNTALWQQHKHQVAHSKPSLQLPPFDSY